MFYEFLSREICYAGRGIMALNVCRTKTDLDRFVETFHSVETKHAPLWRKLEGQAA